MAQSFIYQVSPMRVVFGTGTVAQLADELDRLGIARALVLASRRQQAELGDLASLTGGRMAGVFTARSCTRRSWLPNAPCSWSAS